MSLARIWRARFWCSSWRVSQGKVSSRRRSNRVRFFSRTGALLGGGGISVLAGDGSETAKKSIDDRACVKQVFERAECGCGGCTDGWSGRGQVGPIGRNQRFAAIGQNENEKEPTFAMHGPENVERSAFERMARANNGDLFGEVLRTGSVS
jgi:hypothetical protein